jgi:CspA family cold shock protein
MVQALWIKGIAPSSASSEAMTVGSMPTSLKALSIIVVGFKDDQGYGWIRPDGAGGADVFVHARDISNADKLSQGQRVSFELIMDQKRGKSRADRVRVL